MNLNWFFFPFSHLCFFKSLWKKNWLVSEESWDSANVFIIIYMFYILSVQFGQITFDVHFIFQHGGPNHVSKPSPFCNQLIQQSNSPEKKGLNACLFVWPQCFLCCCVSKLSKMFSPVDCFSSMCTCWSLGNGSPVGQDTIQFGKCNIISENTAIHNYFDFLNILPQ